MITIDALVVSISGLDRAEIEHWIAQDWVRPTGTQGDWRFAEIDVARLRLIQHLRRDVNMQEEALPVVLHLLDQLYDARRQLLRLCDALERTASPDLRQAVLAALAGRSEE